MKLYLCLLCLVVGVSTRYAGEIKMERLERVTTNVAEHFQVVMQLEEINTTASPFCIQLLLANLYLGAAGETAIQIDTVLELHRFTGGQFKPHEAFFNIIEEYFGLNKSVAQIFIATYISVPANYFLVPKFVNRTGTYYPETKMEFHNQTDPLMTEKKINDYFKNKTDGHITDIVKPGSVSNETGLVLCSALFFAISWAQPFLAVDTLQADFHINSTTSVKADIMYDDYRLMRTKRNDDLGYTMAEMETADNLFSVFFILPNPGNNITNLEKTLAEGNNSNELFENLVTGTVEFGMPKFHFESYYELKSPLQQLGMRDAFDPAQANFSALSKNGGAYVSKFYHKAIMEINENGTAPMPGATYIRHRGTKIAKIILNRPFILFCRDNKNGLVLVQGKFWGR